MAGPSIFIRGLPVKFGTRLLCKSTFFAEDTKSGSATRRQESKVVRIKNGYRTSDGSYTVIPDQDSDIDEVLEIRTPNWAKSMTISFAIEKPRVVEFLIPTEGIEPK